MGVRALTLTLTLTLTSAIGVQPCTRDGCHATWVRVRVRELGVRVRDRVRNRVGQG